MKKLFLLPLVAIGLALVPAKQADAQVSIGVGPSRIRRRLPGIPLQLLRISGILRLLPAQLLRWVSILPNVLLHWAAVLLQRLSI
jgi:hypothetical protein